MPENRVLVPRYAAGESTAPPTSLRITLEPEYVDRRDALTDLSDVDAMLVAARSGASARGWQLSRCRWAEVLSDGHLRVTLSLHVWPSDPEMVYALSVPDGALIGPPEAASRPVRRKFWIAGDTRLELPWRLLDPITIWTPGMACYDGASQEVPPPSIQYDTETATILFDSSCYGLLSVSGSAVGYRHDLIVDYDKIHLEPDSSRPTVNRIQADDIDIMCSWRDETGADHSVEARQAIPRCVRTLLAGCPDGKSPFTRRVVGDAPRGWVVYYNTCNGRVLRARKEEIET